MVRCGFRRRKVHTRYPGAGWCDGMHSGLIIRRLSVRVRLPLQGQLEVFIAGGEGGSLVIPTGSAISSVAERPSQTAGSSRVRPPDRTQGSARGIQHPIARGAQMEMLPGLSVRGDQGRRGGRATSGSDAPVSCRALSGSNPDIFIARRTEVMASLPGSQPGRGRSILPSATGSRPSPNGRLIREGVLATVGLQQGVRQTMDKGRARDRLQNLPRSDQH